MISICIYVALQHDEGPWPPVSGTTLRQAATCWAGKSVRLQRRRRVPSMSGASGARTRRHVLEATKPLPGTSSSHICVDASNLQIADVYGDNALDDLQQRRTTPGSCSDVEPTRAESGVTNGPMEQSGIVRSVQIRAGSASR